MVTLSSRTTRRPTASFLLPVCHWNWDGLEATDGEQWTEGGTVHPPPQFEAGALPSPSPSPAPHRNSLQPPACSPSAQPLLPHSVLQMDPLDACPHPRFHAVPGTATLWGSGPSPGEVDPVLPARVLHPLGPQRPRSKGEGEGSCRTWTDVGPLHDHRIPAPPASLSQTPVHCDPLLNPT